jgi:hypothetical protein
MLFFIFVFHSLKCGFSRCVVEEVTLLCAQVVPIALQQQAVEAGRARDKGRVADVASVLPASSQVNIEWNLCVLLLLCICSWLIACLQAVLRAFAHVLTRRSTTDDAGDGVHLKELFELFLIVLCDAIVGWDALLGREAKHSRRFLRLLIRHLHTDVPVLVGNDGNDGNIGVIATCESSGAASDATLRTAYERDDLGYGAGRYSSAGVHENVAIHFSDIAVEESQVVGENLAAAVTLSRFTDHLELAHSNENEPAAEALYLGVALEEQCMCEWSGLRIPAVLGGMLMALSTPVDVMLDSLSSVASCDDDAAAVVFAELESLCVGRSGDADVVCEAIVSKRSVHGAGLDVGLLRVWLRRLPDAVSF